MNRLYFGDNLAWLRNAKEFPDASVDLVYLDPPFNSNADYNVLFREPSGAVSQAQFHAFTDTWNWTDAADTYHQFIDNCSNVAVVEMMKALHSFLKHSPMMAYLAMMAPRLVDLRRILKPTGSLYLHCDPTASHYLRVLLDEIFGAERFQNEIVWKRTTAHNDPKRFGRIGDRLLFYSKAPGKTFNRIAGSYSEEQLKRYKYEDEKGPFRAENLTAPHFSETRTVEWRGTNPGANRQWRFSVEELERLYAEGLILLQRDGRPRKDGLKEYLHEAEGPPLQDIWTDIGLGPTSGERLGYHVIRQLKSTLKDIKRFCLPQTRKFRQPLRFNQFTTMIATIQIPFLFGINTLLAQETSDYATSRGVSPVVMIIWLLVVVLMIAAMWKVFTKAGQPGWASIIPIYNMYIWCKIVGRPGWWVILMLIPFVNIIVGIIVCIDLAKSFGKGVGFGIGLILLGIIFLPILGFGGAQYQGPSAAAAA